MQLKTKLSTLWIVVMFTMVFADILSFISPGFFQELATVGITSSMLLAFAIFLEIPILMIFVSRYFNYSINRWLNIVAAVVTILFVIGGGSLTSHYIFFASIETLCMLLIIWYAWNWTESNNAVASA